MPARRDDPRSIILRRRALLVGSALASLGGCGPEPRAEEPHAVVDVPAAGSSRSMPEPEGRAGRAEGPSDEDELPPLEVPADADGLARRMYEQLAKRIPKLHERLAELKKGLPKDCSIADSACHSRWEAVIRELQGIDREIENIEPLCGGSSEQAQRYGARARAHADYARRRRQRIESEIVRELARSGQDAVRQWKLMNATQRTVTMRPCLSCIDW